MKAQVLYPQFSRTRLAPEREGMCIGAKEKSYTSCLQNMQGV